MARQMKPKDPEWTYPYATRRQIENLRIYFSHFATRIRGWHQQKDTDTHALPRVKNKWGTGIPFESVPPQHRARVEAWFNRKLAEIKAQGITPSPGKIRSLRMNAANFGRHVLTGHRRIDRAQYEMRKRKWLRYLSWKAAEERKELLARRGPNPSKVLEIS
jgi:hypothetical protein